MSKQKRKQLRGITGQTTKDYAGRLADLRKTGGRLQSLDAIRGLAVCLMVGHHFFFDLVEFAGAPLLLFSNPVFDFLHIIFSGCFIMLCGISCRLSHNNLRRGLVALVAAVVITVVTYGMDHYFGTRILIAFGVLHMLACCILIYTAVGKLLNRIPHWVEPILYVALLLLTWKLCYMRFVGNVQWLFPFGLIGSNFYWSDYYPLFPWLFVFLMGTWLGRYLIEGRFPKIFYTFRFPLLAWFGRKTLVIYLVHQPILYGLTLLIIRNRG